MTTDWRRGEFALATIHRAENTDDPARLASILSALDEVSRGICPVLLPVHPRTESRLRQIGWAPRFLSVTRPVSYLQMLQLEARARFILTDSGGVQKEAYFMCSPCITLRDETEWVETLDNDCNRLVGSDATRIVDAASHSSRSGPWLNHYGDGRAADATISAILAASEPASAERSAPPCDIPEVCL